MAYQAKRSRKVIEEFELVNENGSVVERIHVELDADSMVEKLCQKYINLLRAQENVAKVQEGKADNAVIQQSYQILGVALSDLIEAVFGAEDTKKIYEFYEGRYVDMSKEVGPFILEVVIPRVNEIAKHNKKEVLSKFNRKQRRALLKGWR